MEQPPAEVLLHSSWRGLILAYASASLLSALAVWAVAASGATVISVVLALMAVVATAVVVFDYPISCAIGPDGIVRRCLLRRERLEWARVEGLTRTSDSVTAISSDKPGQRRTRISRKPGGLVAMVGRRRYLLVNQCESREECRVLRLGLEQWSDSTRWFAGLPLEDQEPTWLYRRRRHRPENG